MCVKLQQLKSKTANLSGEIHDLQQGFDFTNEEVETLVINSGYHLKKKKLEDLEHRSKKDNIVMWNIPVGAEKGSFCQDIVSNILRQHINLEGDLEAMRAQSSNKHKAKYN